MVSAPGQPQAAQRIEVRAQDLPLHCPSGQMLLWNAHPRVFLTLDGHGEARCPYCGTHYVLTGEAPRPHHG